MQHVGVSLGRPLCVVSHSPAAANWAITGGLCFNIKNNSRSVVYCKLLHCCCVSVEQTLLKVRESSPWTISDRCCVPAARHWSSFFLGITSDVLGFLSHLPAVLTPATRWCFHVTTREGSEREAINWDGGGGEGSVERETDYVWLLVSDPITLISRSWWTHSDTDGSEITIWIYYSLDPRVRNVRGPN